MDPIHLSFYKTFPTSYNYTKIDNPDDLMDALSAGTVMVRIELEK